MTLQHPVTVTLDVSALLSTYCTLLARAALLRIERAEADAYWASEAGLIRSNQMRCGEQDAVFCRLDGLTSQAEWNESAAATIAAAITAAGYTIPKVIYHELVSLDLLNTVISHKSTLATVREGLREIVTRGLCGSPQSHSFSILAIF